MLKLCIECKQYNELEQKYKHGEFYENKKITYLSISYKIAISMHMEIYISPINKMNMTFTWMIKMNKSF